MTTKSSRQKYDLAREAGVSISTVSKALSGSYTISEKTRRHVLETARRLQYKPNARARSFARQKSGTVIFATELYQSIAFENPHMFAILTGVTRSLEEKGYSVLLKHMDKGGATAYVRELMQERLADGVILHAALLSRDLAAFLSHADAPYLVIGRPNFPCNICWMDVNHELAGGVAANYLLDRGYRRILYLGGGPEDAISQMRLKGMEAVLREEELTVDTLFGDTPYTEDVEELQRRLSGENRPEVALCANNHIALECLQCAMQLGLRIPRDLALMTFDRYPFSQLLIPRLTAVEVDMFDMGWEAARFLVQKIKKPLYSKADQETEAASMSAMVVFPLYYLALVLTMTAATILTVQQLSETDRYRGQFALLRKLGMDRREMRRALGCQFATRGWNNILAIF